MTRTRSLHRRGGSGLGLSLGLALALLLQAWTPVLGQSLGVIRSLEVTEVEGGTMLSVESSRKLEWTANWLSAEKLQITFPAAVARDDVADLAPESSLIAAVAVRPGPQADRPATLLVVGMRHSAGYSAEVRKKRIEFTFASRGEPAASPQEGADVPAAEPVAGVGGPAVPGGTASAAPSSPTEPTPAAREELTGEYHIGPGDLLEISVFGLDDFDRTVRVLRDGSISLPLLGSVRLADMTLQQAQTRVADMLAERQLVNDPQVSFFVKEYVSRGVSVQGAVEKPGIYQMIQQRTLLEILGEAGGLSGSESNRAGQQIFVIRKTADGQQTRLEVDAEQLVNQGRADLNINLYPGDVVLVPFAQRNRVYVSGAVVQPGPVEFLSSEGITVLQAITAAGGPTERGNLGNVAILRRLADGTESRTVVNVKKIRKGRQQDVPLERNDTVIVGEWFF